MTEFDKEEYVEKHFLDEAVKSISECGRYWSSTIPRVLTGALANKLSEAGYPVIVWELPPQWEHVFHLQENFSQSHREIIERIAQERYELMEEGKSKEELPT